MTQFISRRVFFLPITAIYSGLDIFDAFFLRYDGWIFYIKPAIKNSDFNWIADCFVLKNAMIHPSMSTNKFISQGASVIWS